MHNPIIDYYKRKGLIKTLQRSWEVLKRSILFHKDILFWCELTKLADNNVRLPDNVRVTIIRDSDELSKQDIEQISGYRNGKLVEDQIRKRFEKGALLWLIKRQQDLMGFVWSIQQADVDPYFYPLTKNDTYLFDVAIFSTYRGLGLMSSFIDYVILRLRDEGIVRAFGYVNSWNTSMVKAMLKNRFLRFGVANKFRIFGKQIVIWWDMSPDNYD